MDPNNAFRNRHKADFPHTIPAGEGRDLVVKQFMNRLAYSKGFDKGPVKVVIVEGMNTGDFTLSTPYITGVFHVEGDQFPPGDFINLVSGRCYRYNVADNSVMFIHAPEYEAGGTK